MALSDARVAATDLTASLRALSSPIRAAAEKRYLKSDLDFFGTGVPAVHKAVAAFLKEHPDLAHEDLLAVAAALWETAIHECRAAAVFLLDQRAAVLEPGDLVFLERALRESRTWALVDELATGPIGKVIAHYPRTAITLDRWAVDEDFWLRRAAMLAMLIPLRQGDGDWERFTRYAEPMLGEREFFIRKAIGWILRETSKKRPALVADWLLPRVQHASGVTVREAVRHLDIADRQAIMAAYNHRPR